MCFIKFCSFLFKKECRVSFWIFFYGKTKSANERALVLSLEVDEKAADAFDDTRTYAKKYLSNGNMAHTNTQEMEIAWDTIRAIF